MDDDDNDDEFGFSDEGLDDLPADTLLQLETDAIRATQHEVQYETLQRAPESDYGDYDDAGDEVINLDEQAGIPQASAWAADVAPRRQHDQAQQDYNYDLNGAYGDGANDHGAQDDTIEVDAGQEMEAQEQPTRSQVDVHQLLLRIKKLAHEKAQLSRDLQSEKSKYQHKFGEADGARRRLEHEKRETDRRLQSLQQSHDEVVAKQKAELEQMRREQEQAQTNVMFLEHDQQADKSRRPRRNLRDNAPGTRRAGTVPSPTGTPKKKDKSLPWRGDGFDDGEVVMASPTKNRDKAKPATPKQAGKRKRQVTNDSPIAELQLEPRDSPVGFEPPEPTDKPDHVPPEQIRSEDHRYQVLQRLVNNRSSNGTDRVLEALTQYALPSQPEKKLSSIVHDKLFMCSLKQDAHELAVEICHIFLTLWEQCLQEKYYDPVYLFLDALQYVLASEPCATAVVITERAVPIIMASIDLVAYPIARAFLNERALVDLSSPAQHRIDQHIDALDCLDLLDLIATSSATSTEALTRFWQRIHIEHIIILLKRVQPLQQVILVLRILSTSALPSTLGHVASPDSAPESQAEGENTLINQLSNMLSETPGLIPPPKATITPGPGPTTPTPATSSAHTKHNPQTTDRFTYPYSTPQILDLRLQILSLLTTFALTPHGSHRLATHRLLIPRLILFLNTLLMNLYALSSPTSPTHSLTITSINATVKLIAFLKQSNPHIDVRAMMNGVPGGSHVYMVALTRVAFVYSEEGEGGWVVECGIEKEVCEAAFSLLDEFLTPEEGEGLLRVFSSAGSG